MNYETANQILILLHESIASKQKNLHHPIFLLSIFTWARFGVAFTFKLT